MKNSYFTRLEWRGFWITTLISFGVYLWTLAPNVTLEDSGEFLTAAYNWGVPHPPGYPIWAISANIFERIIPFGNAAWRGNLMSAFYGSLAVGMLTLITCKIGRRLWNLEAFKDFEVPGISRDSLVLMGGVVAGLVFAFIDTVWSQAVIAEVYTLNGFFFTSLCLLVLRMFDSPKQWRWPCLVGLTFGLGITNHQTLLVSAPAFLYAFFVADRVLCRDTAFLGGVVTAIFAWQSGLWFMWILVAGLLLIAVVLFLLDPHAASIRNVISGLTTSVIGCVGMAIFLDTAPWSTWNSLSFWSTTRGAWLILAIFLLGLAVLFVLYDLGEKGRALRSLAPFLLSFSMFAAGASVYLYMPLSSATNPPMNWGYTKTLEGFRHHITRGQYERIRVERDGETLLRKVARLKDQYNLFFKDLQENFSLPLTLLGIAALTTIFVFNLGNESREKEKEYLIFSVACFALMGLLLVFLLNPKFDVQSVFINRVFYSLAHGVYALWIGLGAILLPYFAQNLRSWWVLLGGFLVVFSGLTLVGVHYDKTWAIQTSWLVLAGGILLGMIVTSRFLPVGVLVLGYLIPAIPLCTNWKDSEMRGHDFGWRYGHDMLKDMDRDAVVYGGTDPGRFVPTYMIFVESFQPERWRNDPKFDRRDLYIITQNALADNTYLHYIRDHYDVSRPRMGACELSPSDSWLDRLGKRYSASAQSFLGREKLYPKEPLILPDDGQFNEIFSQVVQSSNGAAGFVLEKDETGKAMRANVQGIEGVFAINGAIAKWIFDRNKDKHTFYLEESYPIQWMYPYLEPFGLIMKLNKEPTPVIDPNAVRKDMEYWKNLVADLMRNPGFLRDDVARKSYSKLRSSLAGLYLFRKMGPEAEQACRESIALYPSSAEARSRLAEFLVSSERFDEAVQNCEEWRDLDPYNPAALQVLNQVQQFRAMAKKEQELASYYETSKDDPNYIFQYAQILAQRLKTPQSDEVIDRFLKDHPVNIGWWQTALQIYAQNNRPDRLYSLLQQLVERDPKNAVAWFNLAAVECSLNKTNDGAVHLERALKLDGNLTQNAKVEPRFGILQETPVFQKYLK